MKSVLCGRTFRDATPLLLKGKLAFSSVKKALASSFSCQMPLCHKLKKIYNDAKFSSLHSASIVASESVTVLQNQNVSQLNS